MQLHLLPLLAAPLLAPQSGSASGHRVWVPLTSTQTEKGQPAELRFVQQLSSEQTTTLELEIFGYWQETIVGPDGQTYERLDFPGLGELGQIGAPELPALRTRLAVATDASSAIGNVSVLAGDVVTAELLLYPEPIPGADGEDPGPGNTTGSPEVFQKDDLIYASPNTFPADAATPLASVEPYLAAIPTAEIELFPVRYIPADKRLAINRLTTYTYRHEGTPTLAPSLTLDKFAVAEGSCPNWPSAAPWIQSNTDTYNARYLIVTPEEHIDDLQPFIAHRSSQGFSVTVIRLESLPAVICGDIRAAIGNWYSAGPANFDHYCLLVGDSDVLPQCTSPTIDQVPTDDLYGSPFGVGDLDEEIFVGRLSVDNGDDVFTQTAKIIAYELDDDTSHDYSDVALVAHEEDAPEKYVGAHEDVADFPYASPLSFQKFYGNEIGATDAAVQAAIDADLGLVAYRGHGSTNTWSDWNLLGESFSNGDVVALNNDQLPVVWSFSCTNSNLDAGDGIGENWMESSQRAVAHYGSSRVSGTLKNHTLDQKMFEAVFDLGITTHGQAMAWAEDQVRLAHPNNTYQNEWMYGLLGCPAMKVRRGKPKGLDIVAPSEVQTCTGPNCFFTVQIVDANGIPQPNILVTVLEQPLDPTLPEVLLFNGYTGTGGTAAVPGPTEIGLLIIQGRDDDGNVANEILGTSSGAFTNIGDALLGTDNKFPVLLSDSTLVGGTTLEMDLTNALPNTFGLMSVGFVDSALPVFGGIIHPFPSVIDIPVATDGEGAWKFDFANWPAMNPNTILFWQIGLIDPGAVEGISLSNALRSKQP